jgi:outer membrane protein
MSWWPYILFLFLFSSSPIYAQPKQIGIVLDGPWARNDAFVSVFKSEIQSLLQGEFEFQFKDVEANWTEDGVKKAIDS